ncbi:MAG TPA: hypothetical protein PLD62_05650 [Candidatus Cloacimonadota bacterium]|nr:hypothetical protein [Candidatus Cloacimonadota bacterium]
MSQERIDEVVEVILTDKDSRKKMKELGITDKELKKYLDAMANRTEKTYHRILAEDEKRVLTPKAFGYLSHLLQLNSIDIFTFEKVITVCMQLNAFLKKRIDKEMMDEIVNYMIFSGQNNISLKELIDLFYVNDMEYDFEEDVN